MRIVRKNDRVSRIANVGFKNANLRKDQRRGRRMPRTLVARGSDEITPGLCWGQFNAM